MSSGSLFSDACILDHGKRSGKCRIQHVPVQRDTVTDVLTVRF